jgi:hypothetical protein
MSQIDLNNPPPGHNYTVKIEKEAPPPKRGVRLFKEGVRFMLVVAFVGIMAGMCIHATFSPRTTAEEKKWAMSILSAATGGMIGYLLKK